jgi:hypothetical protein
LEENEVFEQTLLRGSQVSLEQQPSTADIDTLMRSMMATPKNNAIVPESWQSSDSYPIGVMNRPLSVNGSEPQYDKGAGEISGIKASKRSRNGSYRNLVT